MSQQIKAKEVTTIEQPQEVALPWTQPGWLEEAAAWIYTTLQRQGVQVNGKIEQPHIRPWSTVLRVPTSAGLVFFKATAPTLAHEPAVTQALAQWRPDCMPQVLAADLERGWLLLPDLGSMLRSQINATADLWPWRDILPLYAALQQETAERLPTLLAAGMPDRRLDRLADQYAQLLADEAAMIIGQPDGLTREQYAQLQALTPRVAAMCRQLAGYGLPETIHHEDFHDANVFVRDGRYLLSDWGEVSASHPFCSLLVTLRSIAYRLKLEEDAAELVDLRDCYLDAWSAYGSRAELRAAADLAYALGMVCRALTWHRVIAPLEAPLKAEYAEAVPGWLQDFLAAQPQVQ